MVSSCLHKEYYYLHWAEKNQIMFSRILLMVLVSSSVAMGQTISSHLPHVLHKTEKYVFYHHGAVVTVLGDNAINQAAPEWGPYEYSNILDSLRKQGCNVISEIRQQNVDDSVYVNKVVAQVDSLLKAGVPVRNILLVGASAGWNVTIHAADRLRNKALHYVIIGGCWPETYKDYNSLLLYGHFLSIIEATDPHGTCVSLFETRKSLTSYREIKLNTGLSHGFIHKGYREWINPIVQWWTSGK